MNQFKEIPVPLESWEQAKIVEWKRENQDKYPELQLLFSSLNGIRLSFGLRAKAKAQGLEPGYPDLMLDVPRGGFHGLRIELKRVKGGAVSDDQKRVISMLQDQGYCVEVCKGHVEAINTIVNYLNDKRG